MKICRAPGAMIRSARESGRGQGQWGSISHGEERADMGCIGTERGRDPVGPVENIMLENRKL